MPLDPQFDFEFSQAQKTAINTGLDMILSAFKEASTQPITLTAKERQKTPSIAAKRMPYVRNAVQNMLPLFPDLESPSIPLDRATRLFNFMLFMQSIAPKVLEIKLSAQDMSINAEYLLLKSISDSYKTAQQQEGRLPGADVFLKELAPLFAKTQNPTQPTSHTNTNT